MHPESWLGWLVFFPTHSRCVEKIEVPYRGTKVQGLLEQVTELTLRVPCMDHVQAFEGLCLDADPLKAVVTHHWEPNSKTLQLIDAEFLEQSADNTLPVLAHWSRG